jgi:hypothetical protein
VEEIREKILPAMPFSKTHAFCISMSKSTTGAVSNPRCYNSRPSDGHQPSIHQQKPANPKKPRVRGVSSALTKKIEVWPEAK